MIDPRRARGSALACGVSACALLIALPAPALAQAAGGGAAVLDRADEQDRRLAEQAEQIRKQAVELDAQRRRLDEQERLIRQMFGTSVLDTLRGGGEAAGGAGASPAAATPASPSSSPAVQAAAPPAQPVGQAPAAPPVRVETSALPQEATVLTPPGHLTLEPDVEYTQTTTNRLVFKGVELVPGLNLGAIEASGTVRSITVAELSMRYGIARNFEVEARVPYLWRSDRIETVQQNDQQVTREIDLHKAGLGDLEFAARYQINPPRGSDPVFVAGLRLKTHSGSNPYLVPRDSFGVARALATGSGFWGIEPSLSFLLPSDPAVIYGSIGYFQQFSRDMRADIGAVHIGRVSPGGSIGIAAGFGAALNDRFSFSLGYKHNYIFPTTTTLGSVVGNVATVSKQRSTSLQVGVLQFGASYAVSRRSVLGFSFEFGVTSDAPNVHITIRAPTSL